MIDPALVPTPLLAPGERQAVEIREPTGVGLGRGLRVATRMVSVLLRAGLLAFDRSGRAASLGRLVRRAAEDLGGLWIKLAQVLSLRHDLFPIEFCLELMKVQDQARGFPVRIARAILEEDLGQPVDEVFSEFDDAPLAAASIGQVHAAVLRRGGFRVAVKIQRPGITEAFEQDMRLARRLLVILRRFGGLSRLRLDEIYWELQDMMVEELDYRREAHHIKSMRRILRRMDMVAPKTWARTNRRRVLVMEYVEGVFLSDYLAVLETDRPRAEAWLAANGIDPGAIGRKLYHAFLQQVLEEDYFHSDLHPGNIALFRNGVVGLIDFGAVGMMYDDFRRPLIRYMQKMAERDHRAAVDRMMYLFEPIPPIDIDEYKREMVDVMRRWDSNTRIPSLPFAEKSSLFLYSELGRVAVKYNMPFDWTQLRMDRAYITMSTAMMHLCPDIDLPREMTRYFEAARSRTIANHECDTDLPVRTVLATTRAVERMTEHLGDLESMFKRNSLSMQSRTSKIAFISASVLRFGRVALTFALVVLATGFVRQWFWPLPVDGQRIRTLGLIDHLPPLGFVDWLLVLALFANLRGTCALAIRILDVKDEGSPNRQ